jgi:hypothetical protein
MKHPALCSLLCPLLFLLLSNTNSEFWNYFMENYWKKCLGHLKQNDPNNVQFTDKSSPNNIRFTDKYVFGILNGNIWKIELEKKISIINSLFIDEIVKEEEENWYFDDDDEETNDNFRVLIT